MKILLVVPPSKALTITPPLGLGYITSFLIANGYEVSIIDSQKKSLNVKQLIRKIKETNPDILGVSVLTSNYENVKKTTNEIKKTNPDIKIVLGGPHPSALPEISLKQTKADFVIRGEGEYPFLKLIRFLEHKNIKLSSIENLCYWQNGRVKTKPGITRIKNLDMLPFPTWNLMPPREYSKNPHQFLFRRYPIAPIITSRGCPFECVFCPASFLFGKELRRRSPQNVVDEIELLVNEFGVKEIHFEDDNFTLIRNHVESICGELIRRKINIVWQCPNGVRVDTLDEDLVSLMKKSGCYRLSFGIESGSQEILNKTGKKLNLKEVSEKIRMVKKQGIEVQGFFIFGLPGETEKTIFKTLKFIKSLDLDLLDIALLVYLPGASLFNQRYSQKDYENINWGGFNYFTGQEGENLSQEKLKEFQKLGMRNFYFNPKALRFLLKNLKIQQAPYILKVLLKYMI